MLTPMPRALDPRHARKGALGAALGVLGSLLAHGLIYAVLNFEVSLPPIDFELQVPSHVEFGMTEPVSMSTPPAPADTPSPAPAAANEAATAQPAEAEAAVAPAPPKPKPKRKKPPADAGVADEDHASPPSLPAPSDRPALAAFAPAGAQIALRVNMARVRDSELAADVRTLLEAVPDWRLILGGSGIDPLRDLERLYLASPDLQRSSVVIAGEYAGDDDLPQRAVANMAEARGVKATWRTARGAIPTAPWPNEDDTARVVALIGPHQFAITRPEDLPRVLAVARALAKRRAEGAAADAPEGEAGDALLGLEDGESLALSVEGAQAFARGNTKGIPERFDLSVRQADRGAFDVRITGHFADRAAAEQARRYWSAMRDRYASHFLVALVGLREPLVGAELEVDGDRLVVRGAVAATQARTLLGFLQGAVSPRGARSDSPRPAGP
jgi:hypothetical protein